MLPTVTVSVSGARTHSLAFTPTAAGGGSLALDLPAGLYQFSVVADARDFDWDSLYEVLNKFHNVDQRTGPWDFSINNENRPLVPAYWVSLNGRRVGLWFFQRVSLEDLAARRFRGSFAFYWPGGPGALEITPQREFTLRWQSAVLESDPQDTLLPALPPLGDPATDSPAAQWSRPEYWARLRAALADTHALYREPLRKACDWVLTAGQGGDDEVLQNRLGDHDSLLICLLLAGHYLEDRPDMIAAALALVEEYVARESWGNPDPEGYAHDGDMGAGSAMLGLAWAYHALAAELGPERRARVLDKLRYHGQAFFELALLNRDYWGGSVLQDHGRRALFPFGAAALHLLGILPEAELWARWTLPRLQRSLDAQPLDGALPLSSYQSLYLYLDYTMHYRETLLALGGEDLLDHPTFPLLVDYTAAVLSADEHGMLISGLGDRLPLLGGAAFLNRAAQKWDDPRAAYLQERVLELDLAFTHPSACNAHYLNAIWGLMTYEPRPAAMTRPPRALTHFADSGLAHWRDDEHEVALAVRCAPWTGWSAYPLAPGPCDRLNSVPASGHFDVFVGDTPRLLAPDSGYRLHSRLRSVLLVDGRGQVGDIGYPMSIPSYRWPGEQIESVRWEEATQTGLIRLNLAPAYPAEAGVAAYTREFLLYPERRLVLRDTVTLDAPRPLSWLFQGRRDRGVALAGLTGSFGPDPALHLTPREPEVALTATVAETPVVFSYSSASGFGRFDHVRYDTVAPVDRVCLEFELRW
ncbi:MAG TPA: hypothetical protein VGM19_07185 [Armatimonadota bacterium]|jgi:hypothetical protein